MTSNNTSVIDGFASDNTQNSSIGSADQNEVNRRFYGELELVHIVAAQVSMSVDNSVEFDELLAAGREGLFEAARRYDPKYGASFRTYANYRVEGAIIDAVRRQLKLPRKAYQKLNALEAASEVSKGNYSPELRDTAQWREVKNPEDYINEEVSAIATAAALAIENAENGSADVTSFNPEQAYEHAELMDLVRNAMAELDEYECKAIKFCCFEEMSCSAAAKAMNVSKPWVHRLYTRALTKLTKRLQNASCA